MSGNQNDCGYGDSRHCEINLQYRIGNVEIKADSKWFLKLLTSLLSVPQEYKGEKREVEYTLSQEDKYLKIIILRSPLYQCWEDEQEQHILHNINRLYVETFKGSYQIEEKGKEKIVSITYPIS